MADSSNRNNLNKLTQEGYSNKFVDSFVDELDFVCAFCYMVVREARQISTCGHVFCASCWEDWLSSHKPGKDIHCPVDNRVVDPTQIFHDRKQDRLILSLRVYCDNEKHGCGATPELRYLQEHLDKCKYRMVACDLYCGEMVYQWHVDRHMTDDCPMRLITHICGMLLHAKDVEDHDKTCPMKCVECELCHDTSIARRDLQHHQKTDCLEFPTFCNFALVGCKEKVRRSALKQHHENHTIQHMDMMNVSLYQLYDKCGLRQSSAENNTHELPYELWGKVGETEAQSGLTIQGDDEIDDIQNKSVFQRVDELEKINQCILHKLSEVEQKCKTVLEKNIEIFNRENANYRESYKTMKTENENLVAVTTGLSVNIDNISENNNKLQIENKRLLDITTQAKQKMETVIQDNLKLNEGIEMLKKDNLKVKESMEILKKNNQNVKENMAMLNTDNQKVKESTELLKRDDQKMKESMEMLRKDNHEMKESMEMWKKDNQKVMEGTQMLKHDNQKQVKESIATPQKESTTNQKKDKPKVNQGAEMKKDNQRVKESAELLKKDKKNGEESTEMLKKHNQKVNKSKKIKKDNPKDNPEMLKKDQEKLASSLIKNEKINDMSNSASAGSGKTTEEIEKILSKEKKQKLQRGLIGGIVKDAYYEFPCYWDVELKREMTTTRSPEFYRSNGYKMDISASWQPDRSQFVIGVSFVIGENDDELYWPWDEDDTMIVTDWETGENYESKLYGYKSPGRKRPPNNVDYWTGNRCFWILSHILCVKEITKVTVIIQKERWSDEYAYHHVHRQ